MPLWGLGNTYKNLEMGVELKANNTIGGAE
jgi:hypothetical protein